MLSTYNIQYLYYNGCVPCTIYRVASYTEYRVHQQRVVWPANSVFDNIFHLCKPHYLQLPSNTCDTERQCTANTGNFFITWECASKIEEEELHHSTHTRCWLDTHAICFIENAANFRILANTFASQTLCFETQ